MLVLVIDTACSVGGVLLARDATEILSEARLQPREFSTQLVAAIANSLSANQSTPFDLDALAVVSGPGSFTGLRVGLSAVKAMAEVTARPVIALSRLAIMASAANVLLPARAGETVHAVLDGGRGEFYHGIYREGGRKCIEESLQTSAGLMAEFNRVPGLVVASDTVVLDAIGTSPEVSLQLIPEVTVREALPLVLSAWRARRFSDVALLDANYLRKLDVERISGTPLAATSGDAAAGLS